MLQRIDFLSITFSSTMRVLSKPRQSLCKIIVNNEIYILVTNEKRLTNEKMNPFTDVLQEFCLEFNPLNASVARI